MFPKKFKIVLIFFLIYPLFSLADNLGDKNYFFVDKNYDLFSRDKILANLIRISQNAYFYVEDDFWQNLTEEQRNKIANFLFELSQEFDLKIYPQLTSLFGFEAKPGIDNDPKITIFFHRLKKGVGGYFREEDGFLKKYFPSSNQREMVYLSADDILREISKGRLAHEFLHLITFNQKNILLNLEEEIWLNEMRSEIAPTILGYNDYLNSRVDIFLKEPEDSVVDWEGKTKDYGVLSLLGHYILEHYGVKIFVDSLKEKSIGIASINLALKKNNFSEDFAEIFKNFLIAIFGQDCSWGEKFCFKSESLKKVKVFPKINFLPKTSESVLRIFQQTKDFTSNWQKIVGGKGNLNLEFEGSINGKFNVSLLLCSDFQKCELKKIDLNSNQKGKIFIPDFDKYYSSLVLIPFSHTRISGFDEKEEIYDFSFTVSFRESSFKEKPLIEKKETPVISCRKITQFLRKGMKSKEVECLQQFLKSQGQEIYPEGLVTGYFGPLTLTAVKRFQQKYWQEILSSWGLTRDQPTGFVGKTTRAKINELLEKL